MDENKAVEIIKKHVERTFPKTCPNCGMVFNSFAEYLRNTTHLGDPILYDAEVVEIKPKNPIGVASYVNCKCGEALVISSRGMAQRTMWRLLLWISMESLKRGIGMNELLRDIRDEIDRRALNECGDD